ncbi:MAG TPA: sigma-54-dependent Fis family transcriptional regulator, partial [Cellvibrio sp.]|nr:sigma-54-dependent Fis family transcriptional regulator [Cellvibrio sp.]
LAKEGKFREDLYFRINVVQLTLPPLRERGRDIINIAESLLQRYCTQFGKSQLKLSTDAVEAIMAYAWPGNVRELENAMQRAVILCEDSNEISSLLLSIDSDSAPEILTTNDMIFGQARTLASNSAQRPVRESEDLSLEDYFQRFVIEHQDSMSETELARKLGVSRKCLWERRQRLGIPRTKNSAASLAK